MHIIKKKKVQEIRKIVIKNESDTMKYHMKKSINL